MLIELLMFNKICIYNKSIAEVLLLSKLYFELERTLMEEQKTELKMIRMSEIQ